MTSFTVDFDKDKQLKVSIGISDYMHPQIFLLMHHDHHHYDLQQKYTQLLEIVVAFGCERFNAAYFTI